VTITLVPLATLRITIARQTRLDGRCTPTEV
jgi:hypothetical protein